MKPRSITDDLASQIKRELATASLRRVQEMHPDVRPGVVLSIKYGSAYADVPPLGAVVTPARAAGGERRTGRGKPSAAAKAFSYSRDSRVPKVLRPDERAAYEAEKQRQADADKLAEREAREALKTEHMRQPYLVQLSVVVGLEPAEDESLLTNAAEAAARQVLGMRGRNRAWAVDLIERIR